MDKKETAKEKVYAQGFNFTNQQLNPLKICANRTRHLYIYEFSLKISIIRALPR
jgi:hypothetical protein